MAEVKKALNSVAHRSGLEENKIMILTREKHSKPSVFCQQRKLNTRRTGLVHIRQVLKSVIISWHCRGILPDAVVEKMFEIARLKDC